MKKTILAVSLTLVMVIAVSSSILLLSQTFDKNVEDSEDNGVQVNETQNEDSNQTINVKIVSFKLGGWGTPAGVAAIAGFNVTIQNLEDKDVDGLTFEAKMLDANGSKLQAEVNFERFDGVLHAREAQTLRGEIISDWRIVFANAAGPYTIMGYVMLGNETLDEWQYIP